MTPGLQPSTSKTNANLGRCPRLLSCRAFSPQLVRQRRIIDLTSFSPDGIGLKAESGFADSLILPRWKTPDRPTTAWVSGGWTDVMGRTGVIPLKSGTRTLLRNGGGDLAAPGGKETDGLAKGQRRLATTAALQASHDAASDPTSNHPGLIGKLACRL